MSDLGQLLRKAREQRGYTLDDIQELTKIRKRYLEAIEEGDYKVLPGSFYVRAFVKNYAEAVGLNAEEVLRLYQKELPQPPMTDVAVQEPLIRPRRRRRSDHRAGRIIVSILMWAFPILIGVVIYYFATNHFASNPDEVDIDNKITEETLRPSPSPTVTQEPSPAPSVIPSVQPVTLEFKGKNGVVSLYEVYPKDDLTLEIEVSGGVAWIGVGTAINDYSLHSGNARDGDKLSFEVTGPVFVNVGRADYVTITIGGVELPDNNTKGSEKFLVTPVDAPQG
ncbi:MAG TPA: helix-turn-helix domain-containing protein [Paenibacillaceae bacterium]